MLDQPKGLLKDSWDLRHDLLEIVRLQVVHEPTDLVAMGQPRSLFQPLDVLHDGLNRIRERTQVFGYELTGRRCDSLGDLRLSHAAEGAVGVMDEHDLARAENRLRDQKRAAYVVGDATSRIADHMRVSRSESEQTADIHARVHAREHRELEDRLGRPGRHPQVVQPRVPQDFVYGVYRERFDINQQRAATGTPTARDSARLDGRLKWSTQHLMDSRRKGDAVKRVLGIAWV